IGAGGVHDDPDVVGVVLEVGVLPALNRGLPRRHDRAREARGGARKLALVAETDEPRQREGRKNPDDDHHRQDLDEAEAGLPGGGGDEAGGLEPHEHSDLKAGNELMVWHDRGPSSSTRVSPCVSWYYTWLYCFGVGQTWCKNTQKVAVS